mgnify:CR=1 FL=1
MLTNHFSIEEQKKFMILENETCHIHGKHPKITFPNDGIEIIFCFERMYLLRRIGGMVQSVCRTNSSTLSATDTPTERTYFNHPVCTVPHQYMRRTDCNASNAVDTIRRNSDIKLHRVHDDSSIL